MVMVGTNTLDKLIKFQPSYNYTREITCLFQEDGDPVSGSEPFVSLDIGYSVLEVAKPLGEVDLKQVSEEVLQISSEVRWESYLHMCACTYIQ